MAKTAWTFSVRFSSPPLMDGANELAASVKAICWSIKLWIIGLVEPPSLTNISLPTNPSQASELLCLVQSVCYSFLSELRHHEIGILYREPDVVYSGGVAPSSINVVDNCADGI